MNNAGEQHPKSIKEITVNSLNERSKRTLFILLFYEKSDLITPEKAVRSLIQRQLILTARKSSADQIMRRQKVQSTALPAAWRTALVKDGHSR